jgi:general secretion pathway protein L
LAIHPKIIKPRWRFKPSPSGLALDLKGVTDEASPKSDTSKYDRRLAIGAALVIGLLAAADFSIHLMLQDQRVAQLKATLQKHYEQSFGEGAAPGEELDQARYRMEQMEQALVAVGGSHWKVLRTLSTFVKLMPIGTSVKVRELTVDGEIILMQGETTSFDAVEQIKQIFASSPQFQEVSVTETRVGATPNQVVFRMSVTVHTP